MKGSCFLKLCFDCALGKSDHNGNSKLKILRRVISFTMILEKKNILGALLMDVYMDVSTDLLLPKVKL